MDGRLDNRSRVKLMQGLCDKVFEEVGTFEYPLVLSFGEQAGQMFSTYRKGQVLPLDFSAIATLLETTGATVATVAVMAADSSDAEYVAILDFGRRLRGYMAYVEHPEDERRNLGELREWELSDDVLIRLAPIGLALQQSNTW